VIARHFALVALVACAHEEAPKSLDERIAELHGRPLAPSEWQGIEYGVGNANVPRSACGVDLGTPGVVPNIDCEHSFITDELALGNEGGEIDAVVETTRGFVVLAREHHSCGAYLPQGRWRLALPKPVRPVEVRDISGNVTCNGQP